MMMAVDSSWNVDEYHNQFEPKEHWQLKQEFILAHKNIIHEDRLVSLAQVYVNMELLGCRYPAPVAMQVRELAKGLGTSYKDSRQNKLQRTFVKASDAVLAKIRRVDPVTTKQRNCETVNRNSEADNQNNDTIDREEITSRVSFQSSDQMELVSPSQEPAQSSRSTKRVPIVFDIQTDQPSSFGSKVSGQFSSTRGAPRQGGLVNKPDYSQNSFQGTNTFLRKMNISPSVTNHKKSHNIGGLNREKISTYLLASNKPMDLSHAENLEAITSVWSSNDPLAKLILVNRRQSSTSSAKSILNQSFAACGMIYTVDPDPQSDSFIAYMNNTPLQAVPISVGLKAAKDQLALAVLEDLCQHCCMLEIKKPHFANSQQIQTDEIEKDQSSSTEGGSQAIASDNIGNKMLKMMGWTGGGLGKDGTGRAEPIEPSMMSGREGLGYTGPHGGGVVTADFKKKTVILIKNFMRDVEDGISETGELCFSPNFSKEQRAFIHCTARRFKLKSTSYGKDNARYLVLGLKLTVHQKLLQALKHGSSNDTFAVYLPGTYDTSSFDLTPF